ncbi:MAG: prepilin-type N-terminal cleavage/methylation domain-containing protein [Alphaproteobacteria bacterium]|nr:prepilin-type N-terminal cleavage/methylation domain-containing protein [Alphaproteobacteria bacterium]
MLKRNKQKGITLLELVLVLGLLGIVILILIKYINEKAKELKLQTTAHQMERTIDDSTDYVSSRFTKMYNDALANGGVITLDLDNVYTQESSDLLSYTGKSPYSSDYEAVVRIPYNTLNPVNLPEEKSLQIIIYAINDKSYITWLDSKNLSRIIKDAQGGIVYSPSSLVNPCTASTNFCISNPYGIWKIEDDLPIANTSITTRINDILAKIPVDRSPAIAIISNITESDAATKYLSQNENLDNRNENTMETDLNIDNSLTDASSIFFNAVPDTDINAEPNALQGSHLTYNEGLSSLQLDSDGNIITDNNGDNVLSKIGAPSLTFSSNKQNSAGEDEVPVFKSKGGFKTNFSAAEGTSCDLKKTQNVIAVDSATGELLRCYENENYKYNPDSDNDGNIDTPFVGDWRKIDWKKSMYFLSGPVPLLSDMIFTERTSAATCRQYAIDNGPLNPPWIYTCGGIWSFNTHKYSCNSPCRDRKLCPRIYEFSSARYNEKLTDKGLDSNNIKHLILETKSDINQSADIIVDGVTYNIFHSYDNNKTSQSIIPVPINQNIIVNVDEFINLDNDGNPLLEINVIGYIK